MIQGSQRLSRIVAIVAGAAVLEPVSFAALAVALALTDLIRTGLLAYDVSAIRLLSADASAIAVGRVLGTHLGAKLLVGAVAIGTVLAFSLGVYGPSTTVLVLVASTGTLPASVAGLLLARRQAELHLASFAMRVAGSNIIGVVTAVAGLMVTRQPIAIVVGLALGDISTLLLLAGGLSEAHRPSLDDVITVIRGASRLLTMQLSYIGQFRIGTVILGAFGTALAVGEYTVASRAAEGFVILASAITASSLPMMGVALAREDRQNLRSIFSRSYSLSIYAAGPLMALLSLSAPIWIGLLFPRYPGAALAFIPVGLTITVYFASSQTSAFLNASHRDPIAAASAVSGLIATTVTSLSWVGLGSIGVAVARLGGEWLRLIVETLAIGRIAPVLLGPMIRSWAIILPATIASCLPIPFGWSTTVAVLGGALVIGATAVAVLDERTRTAPRAT